MGWNGSRIGPTGLYEVTTYAHLMWWRHACYSARQTPRVCAEALRVQCGHCLFICGALSMLCRTRLPKTALCDTWPILYSHGPYANLLRKPCQQCCCKLCLGSVPWQCCSAASRMACIVSCVRGFTVVSWCINWYTSALLAAVRQTPEPVQKCDVLVMKIMRGAKQP